MVTDTEQLKVEENVGERKRGKRLLTGRNVNASVKAGNWVWN